MTERPEDEPKTDVEEVESGEKDADDAGTMSEEVERAAEREEDAAEG